jgi:hypothetical protein
LKANSVLLHLDDLPEFLEEEPNNNSDDGTRISCPTTLNGRIDSARDVDYWLLDAKKGESVEFRFEARRPESPLNPLLVVFDSSGKELNRTENTSQFAFPAAGIYRLRVSERYGRRGGPRFAYRLRVAPPETTPDFRLSLPQATLTVVRENAVELAVNAKRIGGLPGEIKLSIHNLPKGVTATNTTIPVGKKSTKIKFQAGPKTRIEVSRLTIRGSAEVDGHRIEKTATLVVDKAEPDIDTLLLSVAMPTPFKFTGKYELPFALRGTTHYRRFSINRGGFEGPLYARMADRQIRHQQGTDGRTIAIAPGAAEFDYALNMSTWAAVGLTCRAVVMLYGEIEDFDGSKHTVGYTSIAATDQVMTQPNAGPLAIEADRTSVALTPDEPAEVLVRVTRDDALKLPVTVELLVPDHVNGVESDVVTIPAGDDQAVFRIRITDVAGPFNMPFAIQGTIRLTEPATVRGRPLRAGDAVIARTRVTLVRKSRLRKSRVVASAAQ